KRALQIFPTSDKVWFAKNTAFEKVLQHKKLSLSEHLELDDNDVMFHIKQWQNSDDKILSDLSKRFINRRLFSAFDLDMPDDERENFLIKARQVVENAGLDPNYYFAEDKTGEVPYNFYTKKEENPKNSIYVEDGFSHPQIREISEVSAAVRGLQKSYEIHRICFPSELKDEISKLYHQ
ncbi:MAG: hypothetical protein MUC29_15010, partial [Pyrinomonadaceae bacterium]|nr:hypothetical protein [Pyrinomonadaceae bacterium]